MDQMISLNTKAVLLLTAPLRVREELDTPRQLTLGEYRHLICRLLELGHEPADLLGDSARDIIRACRDIVDPTRLHALLDRGFRLSTAVEYWRARTIWVVSHADPDYPWRLKTRLGGYAPPVLYGVGEIDLLSAGGLAVVGSRHVDSQLLDYAMGVGRLCGEAGKTVISGGARGVDQTAVRGSLEAGGAGIGVLANNLGKAALQYDHRDPLLQGRLVLISQFDPDAHFTVGNAMQRNKLIYALADAALVVNCDFNKGGTWSGAVEQLDKLRLVPIYVRSKGPLGKGLRALREKGAYPWPDPQAAGELLRVFECTPDVEQVSLLQREADAEESPAVAEVGESGSSSEPAGELMRAVQEVILQMLEHGPKKADEIAAELQVSRAQVRTWLGRLVEEGLLVKTGRPVQYVIRQQDLFPR